ncbi:hypothetical protein Ccrd_009995, partial [Cynara cardunculus var. scolymus]
MLTTPRWIVPNGVGVSSICVEVVAHYEPATLTATATICPALLLHPLTTMEEHINGGLPVLDPYTRNYHNYHPTGFFELLEVPPWILDAFNVQSVDLLREAENYSSGRNWMRLHFLGAIGTRMSMSSGIAAHSVVILLIQTFTHPAWVFFLLRQVEEIEVQHEPMIGYVSGHVKHRPQAHKQSQMLVVMATVKATAKVHKKFAAPPLQPPLLSWDLYIISSRFGNIVFMKQEFVLLAVNFSSLDVQDVVEPNKTTKSSKGFLNSLEFVFGIQLIELFCLFTKERQTEWEEVA